MFQHLNSGKNNKTLIHLFIGKNHIQKKKWANTKLNIHWYKTDLIQSYKSYNTVETKKQSVHFEYLILLLQIPYFHTFKKTKQNPGTLSSQFPIGFFS